MLSCLRCVRYSETLDRICCDVLVFTSLNGDIDIKNVASYIIKYFDALIHSTWSNQVNAVTVTLEFLDETAYYFSTCVGIG